VHRLQRGGGTVLVLGPDDDQHGAGDPVGSWISVMRNGGATTAKPATGDVAATAAATAAPNE